MTRLIGKLGYALWMWSLRRQGALTSVRLYTPVGGWYPSYTDDELERARAFGLRMTSGDAS